MVGRRNPYKERRRRLLGMKPPTALLLVCAFSLGLLSQRLIGEEREQQLQLRQAQSQQQDATTHLIQPPELFTNVAHPQNWNSTFVSRLRPIVYDIDSLKRRVCPRQIQVQAQERRQGSECSDAERARNSRDCRPLRALSTAKAWRELLSRGAGSAQAQFPTEAGFVCGFGCRSAEPHLEKKLGAFRYQKLTNAEFEERCAGGLGVEVAFALIEGEVLLNTCGSGRDVQLGDLAEYLVALAALSRLVAMPPVRIIVHGGDVALWRVEGSVPFPSLSLVTSDAHWELAWPSGQLLQDVLEPRAFEDVPWGKKLPKVMWRGGLTGPDNVGAAEVRHLPRMLFMEAMAQRQELADVAFTNVDGEVLVRKRALRAFRAQIQAGQARVGRSVPASHFSRFKYLPNPDGVSSAWRLAELLHTNSTLLKPTSPMHEYIDEYLVPFEHYVPVRQDSADLIDRLDWLLAHDDEARRIAAAGARFFWQRMRPQDVLCYMWRLLRSVAHHSDPLPSVATLRKQGYVTLPVQAIEKQFVRSLAELEQEDLEQGRNLFNSLRDAAQHVMSDALGGRYREATVHRDPKLDFEGNLQQRPGRE